MNENLQALGAFFLILLASILSNRADAAVVLFPTVPGYSGGNFLSSPGSFSMTPANDGFIKQAVVNVGGKPITVPAKLRMAANAGQFAKNAMRLNPWAIAGTLAAGWLLDQAFSYDPDTGTWVKQAPDAYDMYCVAGGDSCCSSSHQDYTPLGVYPDSGVNCSAWINSGPGLCSGGAIKNSIKAECAPGQPNAGFWYTWTSRVAVSGGTSPATEDDWANLPDPLPAIAPELPYAPYMPEGVPVHPPDYNFVPFTTPVGEPYTKPDGSTAQPMATVSSNGDSVTVDTYDQPLTDANGDPVPSPQPQDTPEPSPNHCQQNPNSIGCAEFGTAPAPDSLTTLEVPVSPTVTPVGGAGSCPADITTSIYGLTWSYQPICDFASAIRPLIIGFAWLSFAYIVAGTVRT